MLLNHKELLNELIKFEGSNYKFFKVQLNFTAHWRKVKTRILMEQ